MFSGLNLYSSVARTLILIYLNVKPNDQSHRVKIGHKLQRLANFVDFFYATGLSKFGFLRREMGFTTSITVSTCP